MLWVLTEGAVRRLRPHSPVTGAPLGPATVLAPTVPPWAEEPFGRPFVACCAVPYPLTVHAGAAWTVDAPGRRLVRVARDGAATAVPVEGVPRDVVAGPGGLPLLEVRVPGGGTAAANRVRRVDPATGAPLADPAVPLPAEVFGSYGPLQLAVGAAGPLGATRASVAMALVAPDGSSPVPARILARRAGVTWAKGVHGCVITRVAPDGRRRALGQGWRAGLGPAGRGDRYRRCRLRRIEADARGDLWAIAGNLPRGTRGRVLRIDGDTGRLLARPVGVGTDPVALAPAGRGVWVADGTSRTVRYVTPR